MKNKDQKTSRRKFIGQAAAITAASFTAPSVLGAPSYIPGLISNRGKTNGVRLGVITYSFREMPDQSAEATLSYIRDTGITETELMGDPAETFAGRPGSPYSMREMWMTMRRRNDPDLTDDEKKKIEEMSAAMEAYGKEVAEWRSKVSMDKFAEFRRMYENSGVKIYAFKPRTFGPQNTDAEVDYGFRAAKALGASHVTVEIPDDPAQSERLGRFAAKHKIYMAYHGHEQQTPEVWDTALSQSDYNAMNLDLGHYVAAGNPSPLELIRAKHEHIKSMHVKDRQTPENGKANLPFGKGDTPIIETLQLMRDNKYTFPATIEFEYATPEGSNAVAEVRKCLDYCRAALS
jgi:sugar phosphate isomerase/epimerase